MSTVIDIVEAMQERLGLNEAFRRVCNFVIAFVELFQGTIPLVAKDALIVVKAFWRGDASAEQVELARIKCWEYLDSKSASTDFSNPETCAIRAVICILYAEPPSEDMAELVGWFLTLMEKVDGIAPDLNSLQKIHFI